MPTDIYHPKFSIDPLFIAGCLAGSANIFTGYPFDTVKVRIQASSCSYHGPWSCFTSILKQEGIKGLYRGLSAPLFGGAIETGINYAVFENTLRSLQQRVVPDTFAVPLAAATAAVSLSFVISPVELIKCRMQMGTRDPLHSYKGPMDCFRQVIHREGLRGLSRGFGATLCREIPGNLIYFSTYRVLREILPGKRKKVINDSMSDINDREMNGRDDLGHVVLDTSSMIACGAASGMLMWLVVLPIDVVKTRIQTAWPGSVHDTGIIDHLRVLYREGRRSLYAGLSPTLIRAAPANAAQWIAWEFSIREWEKFKRKEED